MATEIVYVADRIKIQNTCTTIDLIEKHMQLKMVSDLASQKFIS